jgi:2-phosphosulfolactate phosphatase
MRVHVAFTPDEVLEAPVAVVVDVLRATSTITQALASGYRRVYCCREVEDALRLREQLGEGLLGGERSAVRIEGFDIGASPREVLEPRGETLIYSTTNGTRAVLAAASACREVLLGSLLNLAAVTRAVTDDCVIVCAGFQGQFALDDAYCAGRIVELLDVDVTDAAKASALLARSFPAAHAALLARTYGPPGLEEDIRFCAQEDVVNVVPRLNRMVDSAAEITP